jgi:hypothetical protein
LNHWDGLVRFLDDGRIELDTNIVERSIRPIVLNRKNTLFAGHDQGAENWAAIASLVETCKLYGVDPQAYFADVLTKARQSLARISPRRAHALGLGSTAFRRSPRGVDVRINRSRARSAKNQAVRAVGSEDRLQSIHLN